MILAFGHRRGRGKSLAADYAANNLISRARAVHQAAFADSIKEGICRQVFRLTTDQLYGNLKECLDPGWCRTPRNIMQTAGEAMRAAFGQDVFTKSMQQRIADYCMADWVISDLRTPQEFEMIKSIQGRCIRIDREQPMDSVDEHPTEAALAGPEFEWDFVIDNNGTKKELKEAIGQMISGLIGGVE